MIEGIGQIDCYITKTCIYKMLLNALLWFVAALIESELETISDKHTVTGTNHLNAGDASFG